MKKKIAMVCNIIGILLIIVFIIKTIIDYVQYTRTFTSAPFSVWIGINVIFLIIPAIILFIAGFIINKKQK